MIDYSAYGHYFEFAAAANFTGLLYEKAEDMHYNLIRDADYNTLHQEKKKFDDNVSVIKSMSSNFDQTENIKREEKIIAVAKRNIFISLAKIGSKRVGNFLVERKPDNAFMNKYKSGIKPSFPLSGIYCVLMLLIIGFSETYKNYEIIYLNVLVITSITLSVLIFVNIKCYKSVREIPWRNIRLTRWFIWVSLASFFLGVYIYYNPNSSFIHFEDVHKKIFIFFPLFLAGAPIFIILYKNIFILFSKRVYIKLFKLANLKFSKLFNKMQMQND